MSRLIDVYDLIDFLDIGHFRNPSELCFSENDVQNLLLNAPKVDAVPVVHAKWIAQNDALTRFMCSNCKSENHEGFETYCPKCGAKMYAR